MGFRKKDAEQQYCTMDSKGFHDKRSYQIYFDKLVPVVSLERLKKYCDKAAYLDHHHGFTAIIVKDLLSWAKKEGEEMDEFVEEMTNLFDAINKCDAKCVASHTLILAMIDAKCKPPIACKICGKDVGSMYYKSKKVGEKK